MLNLYWQMAAQAAIRLVLGGLADDVLVRSHLLGRRKNGSEVMLFYVEDASGAILAGPWHALGEAEVEAAARRGRLAERPLERLLFWRR